MNKSDMSWAIENDLPQALKNKEFVIYYQPIIHLKTGRIAGAEALIRWKHPKYGIILPENFIKVAENQGLIVPIGNWVLEEACAQTALWHQQGFDSLSLKLDVNLSVLQLEDISILSTLENVLTKTGLNPRFLELEITETHILKNSLIPILQEIRKKGITLAIDNFGVPYTAINYLKSFEIEKINLDKSVIKDISINAGNENTASAIFTVAKELNIKTLAEGVEIEEQLTFLKDKHCDFVQGFYFSKPLTADDFTQLLMSHKNYKV